MARETAKFRADVEKMMKREDPQRFLVMPADGLAKDDVIATMAKYVAVEEPKWNTGRVSGSVYHGEKLHTEFLCKVYSMFSLTNPLHTDIWPSLRKFEAEIVRMTAELLHGPPGVVGSVTCGGSESILMAIKAYRDKAREERGVRRPNLVAPVSAHAAFDKACEYFGINLISIPMDPVSMKVDLRAMARAINGNTIALVASAPQFPHGVIDPVEEIGALAQAHGIGCHVDCCLGGFYLPFAKDLGEDIPPFDFEVPGVTTISADTHKYGFSVKGTSVVLYRNHDWRKYQFYITATWPGGLYASPSLTGSRPGGLIAAAWAGMVALGKNGFRKEIASIVKAQKALVRGTRGIPGVKIYGDPVAMIVSWGCSDGSFNVYHVMDNLSHKGWNLNGLHSPPAFHIALTKLSANESVVQEFLKDFAEAVAKAKTQPNTGDDGVAPIYGAAAAVPDPSLIEVCMQDYLAATLNPEL
jgi:sphinganine-1-phosphate aldolase